MRYTAKASRDFAWLTSRTGLAVTPGFRMIASKDSAGNIRGAVGFDHWTDNSVRMHFALDSSIAGRCLVRAAFSYAFEEAGKGVAIGEVPAWNRKSLWTAEHLGFEPLCRIRDGYSLGVDLVVMELRREKCRWIGGQVRRAA